MSGPKPRSQLKTLTYAEKLRALHEVEKGEKKKSQIAREFGIPVNTLSTYIKNREKILDQGSKVCDKGRKRAKKPVNPDVDECVLKWFKQAQDQKIPVKGSILRAKAEEFASTLGKTNFKASSGWLDGFKKRNGISLRVVSGEGEVIEKQSAELWKSELAKLICGVDPKNIFSASETGLFFKCTPDKTLTFKGEQCSRGKHSKERITLLIGANMDGTEKLPLLMIGKSVNPHCFKNVKTKPVEYKANSKAWMTSDIFANWLSELDKIFWKQNREIVLFVENCTAHSSVPSMSNVRVVFFPPKVGEASQPMKQGVIKNFKRLYRRLLVKNVLSGSLLDKKNRVRIDILEASRMCFTAWTQVTREMIANSFHRAGFAREYEFGTRKGLMPAVDDWENAEEQEEEEEGDRFKDFIRFDEKVETCGTLTEAEILAEVSSKKTNTNSSDEDEEEQELSKPNPTSSQALAYLKELRRFVEGQNDVPGDLFHALDNLHHFIISRALDAKKQQRLSDFENFDDSIFKLRHADLVSPLSKAAQEGNLEEIARLISQGLSPQAPDNRGWTAIHYCVAANQLAALKLILRLKSESKDYLVSLKTWEEVTPLLVAAYASPPSVDMVSLLLESGANPNDCIPIKVYPLHLACRQKGNVDVVKMLLKYGADVNVQEEMTYFTPLHFAICESGDLEIIKVLVRVANLELVNEYKGTPLVEACNRNLVGAVKSILKYKKNYDDFKGDLPALVYAVARGSLETTKLLLEAGADPNDRCAAILRGWDDPIILNKKFLPIYSSLRNLEVFRLLLKLTRPQNILFTNTDYGTFPLFVFLHGRNESFFELLQESNVPEELKRISCNVLTRFLLSNFSEESSFARRLYLIFKYIVHLEPENVFRDLVFGVSSELYSEQFKVFHALAQMGIPSLGEREKNAVERLIKESGEYEGFLQASHDIIFKSVLTLKQWCRLCIRRHVRNRTGSDWRAYQIIKDFDLPPCLKEFLSFEECC